MRLAASTTAATTQRSRYGAGFEVADSAEPVEPAEPISEEALVTVVSIWRLGEGSRRVIRTVGADAGNVHRSLRTLYVTNVVRVKPAS